MPFARSVAASALASTVSSKSIVPTTGERLAGSATNGVAQLRGLGPAVEVARRRARALDAPVEPALDRASTRSGRPAAAASPPRACCRSGPCGSSRAPVAARGSGLPAPVGAVELRDPLDRGGAEQREPDAAVGAEGLLRGEVVGVGLGGSSGRPPAPEVASTSTRASPASAGRSTATMTPVEVSLWAQAIASAPGRRAARARRPARPRPRSGRAGTARRPSTFANLLVNSP